MTDRDTEGVSRQEGQETLQAERSGYGKPAVSGPLRLDVLKGAEAQERSRSGDRLASAR
jgi:hypothetical protein